MKMKENIGMLTSFIDENNKEIATIKGGSSGCIADFGKMLLNEITYYEIKKLQTKINPKMKIEELKDQVLKNLKNEHFLEVVKTGTNEIGENYHYYVKVKEYKIIANFRFGVCDEIYDLRKFLAVDKTIRTDDDSLFYDRY